MPSIGYVAPSDTTVYSGSLVIKFKDGRYAASDPDAIAVLDDLVENDGIPVTGGPNQKAPEVDTPDPNQKG